MKRGWIFRAMAVLFLALLVFSGCVSYRGVESLPGAVPGAVRIAYTEYGYSFSYRQTNLQITQSVANKLEVQGVCLDAPDTGALIITFGSESYTLYVEPDGTVEYQQFILSVPYAESEGNSFEFNVSYESGGVLYQSRSGLIIGAVTYNAETGFIGYPDGTYYITENGDRKILSGNSLPADIAISGSRTVTFVCKAGIVVASIPEMDTADSPDPSESAGAVYDKTDSTVTVDVTPGLEYALLAYGDNGKVTWVKAEEDRLTFEGLLPETEYSLLVRTPGDSMHFPSSAVTLEVHKTLTVAETEAKAAFESLYLGLADKIAENTLTDEDVEELSSAYDALTEQVIQLPSVKEKAENVRAVLDFEFARADAKSEITAYIATLNISGDVKLLADEIVDAAFAKIDAADTMDEVRAARDTAKSKLKLTEAYSEIVLGLPDDTLKEKIVEELNGVYSKYLEKIENGTNTVLNGVAEMSSVERTVVINDFVERNASFIESGDIDKLFKVLDEIENYSEKRQEMLSEQRNIVVTRIADLGSEEISATKTDVNNVLNEEVDGYLNILKAELKAEIDSVEYTKAEIKADPRVIIEVRELAAKIKETWNKANVFEEDHRKPYIQKMNDLRKTFEGNDLYLSKVFDLIDEEIENMRMLPYTDGESGLERIYSDTKDKVNGLGVRYITSSDGAITITCEDGIDPGYTIKYEIKDGVIPEGFSDSSNRYDPSEYELYKIYVIALVAPNGETLTVLPESEHDYKISINVPDLPESDDHIVARVGGSYVPGDISNSTFGWIFTLTTDTLGEFYILNKKPDDTVNLLWVAILLGLIFCGETAANVIYSRKTRKASEVADSEDAVTESEVVGSEEDNVDPDVSGKDVGRSEDEKMYSVAPMILIPLIATVFTPAGIIPAIAVLGALTVASGGILVGQIAMNHRKQNNSEHPTEEKSQTGEVTQSEDISQVEEKDFDEESNTDATTDSINESEKDRACKRDSSTSEAVIVDVDDDVTEKIDGGHSRESEVDTSDIECSYAGNSLEDAGDTEEFYEMNSEKSEHRSDKRASAFIPLYDDDSEDKQEYNKEDESHHRYISPENICLSDQEEEEDERDNRNYPKPFVSVSETEDMDAANDTDIASDEENDDTTLILPADTDEDRYQEKKVFSDHGLKIYVTYDFSFESKLKMSSSKTQHMYSLISEYLLSYKVNKRRSWKKERYYLRGKSYAVMMFRGKTLCVCMAIDPESLKGSKYQFEDVSEVKKYSSVPTMMRIRSGRSCKHTVELIQLMMASAGIPQAYVPEDNFVPSEPVDREALIESGLIRVLATDGEGSYLGSEEEIKSGKLDLSAGGMPLMPVVSAEQAALIPDETAESFVNVEAEQSVGGDEEDDVGAGTRRKGIINIDTISSAFMSGETVTLAELKARGLVPKNTQYVKVLARGLLNKPLTVKAHDFSMDAIKMIIMAGGSTVKLNKLQPRI